MDRTKLTFILTLTLLISIFSKCLSQEAPFTFVPIPTLSAVTGAQVVFEFSKVVVPADDPRELAVAFHSITYIDSIGHALGELTFGTSEANNLQQEGWFGNEIWADFGPFQWAGGSAKKASMQLPISVGTEGLLLKIRSVEDSLWTRVTIDGQLAASLRVDAYWHTGYVPIGTPISEPAPAAAAEWIEGLYFPHFPSTDRIFVIPVWTELWNHNVTWVADFRINQSYYTMMALTLVGVQGIINRSKPRIYLNFTRASDNWIPTLEEHVGVVRLDFDHLSALNFLLERYGSRFTGAVIYDPEVPETINLATMIAGLEDRIILAPEQLELPGIPDFTSVTDLRPLVQEQGWDTSEESKHRIYQWVYDNLWQNLEHRIIGVISPGPPTSQEIKAESGHYYPLGLVQRDYYVALKLPALWLDPRDSLEAELYGRFLADAPSPVPVHGVCSEEASSTSFVSGYGDWITAISWPNAPLAAANLTVFSGIRPELRSYQPQINTNRILATLGAHHVAMIWSSDGDNLHYQMHRGFPSFKWYTVKDQGYLVGWTINPTLANLAPLIWNYYIESRNEVGLVCGLSGAGYTYPRRMNDTQLQDYIKNTATYLNQTGLRTVRVDARGGEGPWNEELATHYYEGLSNTDYLGAVFGNSGSPWGLHFSYGRVSAPAARPAYVIFDSSDVEYSLNHILSRNTDSVLVDLGSDYPWHSGEVVQDAEAVGREAVFFSNTSTEYLEVIHGPYINLAPGGYTAIFRFKVCNNQSSQDFVDISISRANYTGIASQLTGYTEFARKKISPDEFEETNTYKLISLPFTLDNLTENVEVIMSFRGAETDLTADYIQFTQNDPKGFPVFAPLFLIVTSGEPLADSPRLFTEKLESAGGVVLTPDEFIAALNPEYMIEFATPILGAEDSSLTAAKQQLVAGEYFSSLLTVRQALKIATNIETVPTQVTDFELYQNYRNPFNPSTTIQFALPEAEKVRIEVYNILGRKVATLLDKPLPAGYHQVKFDAQYLASGVYVVQIEAGAFRAAKKMLYLR